MNLETIVKFMIEINKISEITINQATGMTKISRGGYFRPGGILVFQLRGVYTPLEKPEVRLLALFGP